MASLVFSWDSFLWNNGTEKKILSILICVVAFLVYKLLRQKRTTKLPPGPIGVPFFGYLPFLGAQPHKKFHELSKKYGDIMSVRLGSKLTIVLNEYSVTKEALTHPAALNRPSGLFDYISGLGFANLNGEEWQEQRRFCMHSMRELGLGRSQWQNVVMEEVTSFLKELESYGGKPADITPQLNCTIINSILALLIGRTLKHGKEDDKIDLLEKTGKVAMTYVSPSLITTLIPSLRNILQYLGIAGYDKAAEVLSKFCSLVKEEVKKHLLTSENEGIKDFISLFLEKRESVELKGRKHTFSDENLEGGVKLLFLGASDTTFNSIAWLFRLMAKYPEVQRNIQNELDVVIGRSGRAYFEERFKIPYTFAVLMEAQRISSIVPLSTTRSVHSDFILRGYTIPKGAEMFSNTWALHNDPNYWEEPEKFKPERFLTEDSKLIINKPSFVPFSIGRRNCPGETVAWMGILAFFTSVMQKFTITLPPGEKTKFEVINGLVTQLKPQKLCFLKRPDSD